MDHGVDSESPRGISHGRVLQERSLRTWMHEGVASAGESAEMAVAKTLDSRLREGCPQFRCELREVDRRWQW